MADRPPFHVPLGDVSPDIGHVVTAGEAPHLVLALSVWPHGSAGYVPARDVVSQGFAATVGRPTGACLFNSDYEYYGTSEGKLFEVRHKAPAAITARYTAPTTGYESIQAWREDRDGDPGPPVGPTFADITADVNDVGGPDAQPFPTVAAIDDAVYFGYSAEQTRLEFNVGVAGVGAYTVVVEYSAANGGWAELPGVTDNTNGFKNVGVNDITFTRPEDHRAFAVGSVTAFWYRVRVDAFSSMTTVPVLTQVTSDYAHARKWSLVRFGDAVIACNEWDPVQVQAVRGESFTALIDSADKPQARYCTTFQGRLVLGWIKVVDAVSSLGARGDFPYTVWMSGIQAANNFDPTDLQYLPIFQTLTTQWGEITGVEEIVDQAIVMLERAAYRISGGGLLPASYSFLPITGASGSRHSRSLVSHGGALHYWGDAGPAIITPSGYGELGVDKLSTTLFSPTWPVPLQVSLDRTVDEQDIVGGAYTSATSILWRYPATDATVTEILLVWNYRTGRFSMIPILAVSPRLSVRLIVDRGDLPEVWEVGSSITLGVWNETAGTTELYVFDGNTQAGQAGASGLLSPPRFVTAFMEILEDQTTTPTAAQVIASPAAGSSTLPELSVTVRGKRDPAAPIAAADQVTVTSGEAAVTSGWMPLHANDGAGGSKSPNAARYHQFDLIVTPTATWKSAEIQALRLRYAESGDY